MIVKHIVDITLSSWIVYRFMHFLLLTVEMLRFCFSLFIHIIFEIQAKANHFEPYTNSNVTAITSYERIFLTSEIPLLLRIYSHSFNRKEYYPFAMMPLFSEYFCIAFLLRIYNVLQALAASVIALFLIIKEVRCLGFQTYNMIRFDIYIYSNKTHMHIFTAKFLLSLISISNGIDINECDTIRKVGHHWKSIKLTYASLLFTSIAPTRKNKHWLPHDFFLLLEYTFMRLLFTRSQKNRWISVYSCNFSFHASSILIFLSAIYASSDSSSTFFYLLLYHYNFISLNMKLFILRRLSASYCSCFLLCLHFVKTTSWYPKWQGWEKR